MTQSTHNEHAKIIVGFRSFDGKTCTQQCATAAVARSCMRVFRSDPTVAHAIAYYTDGRGALETYMAEVT